MTGLIETYGNRLGIRFFRTVYFVDGVSPKLQFSQTWIREDIPNEGYLTLSAIRMS